jgi:tetratricopeptide (TPR) repeat protein
MSYYGIKSTQTQCSNSLRPNKGDKHVRPEELVSFINKQPGLKTTIRENGNLETIQLLLSNGIPVITQQWLHTNDGIGHYRVARGYDTARNIIIFNDSMADHPSLEVDVNFQDTLWKGYDRRYFPIFTPKTEALVMAILGAEANSADNYNRALSAAEQYVKKSPSDADGWRNLGYLRYAGNDCKGALAVWDKLSTMLVPNGDGPYNKFLWYQLWPVECNNRLGNYQTVLKLVQPPINSAQVFAEARYEKAVALNGLGRKNEAKAELKLALLDDPNYQPSQVLLDKLNG